MAFDITKGFSWASAADRFKQKVQSGKVAADRKHERRVESAQQDTATRRGLRHENAKKKFGNKNKPPAPVLKRAEENTKRLEEMRARQAHALEKARDEYPSLDLWCYIVEDEEKDGAKLIKQGVLDWDVLGGLEHAGMLEDGIPQDVRWMAWRVLDECVKRIGKKQYGAGNEEMWFCSPWPPAMGGWYNDQTRAKYALGLH